MPIAPEEWSVVILGAWNRAILTPSGISKRLFKLPEGTPLQVHVPLDVLAPFRVIHNDLSVMAGSDRLIINPDKPTFAKMGEAMKLGWTALDSLPETPVSAAGFNFKYKSTKPLESLVKLLEHSLDDLFAESEYQVQSRVLARHLKWRSGEIRMAVSEDADLSCTVLFNFHMESDSLGKLKDWLSVPIEDACEQIEIILHQYLGVSEGDVNHAEKAV